MKYLCKFLFFNLLCLSIQVNAQTNKTIRSDRPGQTIGPYTVGKNNFQCQTGLTRGGTKYYNDQDYSQYTSVNTFLKYGLTERFELVSGFGYSKNWYKNLNGLYTYEGINDMSLGIRINILNGKEYKPSLGVQLSGNIPISRSNPFTRVYEPKVLLSGTQKISKKFNLLLNLGTVKNSFSGDYHGIYVANLGYAISPKIVVFIENYGSFYRGSIFQKWDTGLAYMVNDNIQLDIFGGIDPASYGYNYFASFGVSWRLMRNKSN